MTIFVWTHMIMDGKQNWTLALQMLSTYANRWLTPAFSSIDYHAYDKNFRMRFFISYAIMYSHILLPCDCGKKSNPCYDDYVYYLF